MADQIFFKVTQQGQTAHIALEGSWTIYHAAELTSSLALLKNQIPKKITVDPQNLEQLDTAGACLLLDWLNSCQEQGTDIAIGAFQDKHGLLFNRVKEASTLEVPPPAPQPNMIVELISAVGEGVTNTLRQGIQLMSFLGITTIIFIANCFRPKKWRMPDLARHIQETGINALPIVSVMAFMISVVLAYQGAYQLRQYGAEIYTIDLTAIGLLREMGVLLTGIMVAGRSGSAFAAELGVMKVNEEIDALRTLGLSPFSVLVLPRILALMITLPLLTFWADMMGLLGAAFLLMTILDISWGQFVTHLQGAIVFSTYGVGLLKAPFFALIIGLVGCLCGMQVTNSAESVGRLTTKAVVQSILLVMLADALLSILFTDMNI
jgi:phospholipid/cholesterol/gamma-HCH transport system permease protein